MSKLGEAEDQIFKKRQETELSFRARDKARKRRMERGQFNQNRPNWNLTNNTQFAPTVSFLIIFNIPRFQIFIYYLFYFNSHWVEWVQHL